MNDKALQRKLNQFVKLGNELDAEAKARYGESGFLFHEADGGVLLMSDDACGKFDNARDRQQFVTASADLTATWGAGAW